MFKSYGGGGLVSEESLMNVEFLCFNIFLTLISTIVAFCLGATYQENKQCHMKRIQILLKACYFVCLLSTILVLLTLMSNQPLVHEGGRQTGRKSVGARHPSKK